MSERVAIDLAAADHLIDEYRLAARAFARASVEVAHRASEAADLLGSSTRVRVTLESIAIDLANDGDDLRWRVDYLRSTDASFDPEEPTRSPRAVGFVPVGAPSVPHHSPDTLAEQLRKAIGSATPVAAWTEMVRDLGGQEHDPAYLAAVFEILGPEATMRVAHALSRSMTSELFLQRRSSVAATSGELRRMLSASLGTASLAVRGTGGDRGRHVLSTQWFHDLFAAGGADASVGELASAELGHLMSAGTFRDDVALHAGRTAIELLDPRGRLHALPAAIISYDHAHDAHGYAPRGPDHTVALLLGAAARSPRAASSLILETTRSGRSAASLIAARELSGDHALLAPTLAELVVSGTITAEQEALSLPVDRAALRDTWMARSSLIDEIARHVRDDVAADPYPAPLNRAFTQMTIETMPHVMRVPPHGDDPVDADFDPATTDFPSADGGLHVPPETLSHLFGALFRHEQDRISLMVSAALEQRTAYAEDPGSLMLRRAGIVEGAVTNGFNLANIDDAEQVVREIEAANARVDTLFGGVEFAAQFVPYGPQAIEATGDLDDLLELAGVNPIEDFGHADTDGIVEAARTSARSEVHASDVRARHFVFGRAYEQMQAELLTAGPDALSDTSRAIFDHMQTEPALAQAFSPGETTIAELRSAGAETWNEYDSATWELTLQEPVLRQRLDAFTTGLSTQHIGQYSR